MANVSIEITGLAEVNAELARLGDLHFATAARALFEEAQIEMTESKRRVPVDTGALRESGRVEEAEEGAVRLVYGDAAVDYALEVHENLEAFHPNGEAKFLERPILESLPHLAVRVGARMTQIAAGDA